MMRRLLLLVLAVAVQGDVYMHNPRGSNNRLDEARRDRNNANRLFDSQNNDRGGYNVGSLYYYEGSHLSIEWTNQHSCNNPNNHCELVIQYMCGDLVRDGTTVTTIPVNPMQCQNYDCNRDKRYGMHETYDYHIKCRLRQRNMGLFTADQNLKGQTAQYTRQNANGNRRGYECPEERDHYPYWHPTPWKDIAVLTNNPRRCPYYQRESENVKGRYECVVPQEYIMENLQANTRRRAIIPNNKQDCEDFRYPTNDRNGTRGIWQEMHAHGLPAPECRETEWTRDNHLGNTLGGYPALFNWTIPDLDHEKCVLRIRYNISTGDFEGWDPSVNSTNNKNEEGVDVGSKFGLSPQEAEDRGYVYKQNPQVKVFGEFASEGTPDKDFELQLAVNTNQYGRVFQDRSHTFAVRKRPEELSGATIHNVNVRGKRGNIVQVYPAVEYDFVPNTLEVSKGDYVHYQWTGSNTNPENNDGQGKAGTDRSNVVLQGAQVYPEGQETAYGSKPVKGQWGRSYPMHLSNATFLGFSKDLMRNLAILDNHQFGGEMSELDDVGTYFDLGPRKVTQSGVFHYMSTRNNNFSNRSQKGRVIVVDQPVKTESVGWNGGNITFNQDAAVVTVPRGTLSGLQKMRLEEWEPEAGEDLLESRQASINVGSDYASNYILISPTDKITQGDKTFKVNMKVNSGVSNVAIYHANPDSFTSWSKLNAEISGGVASFQVDRGGLFVARTETSVGLVVGMVMLVVILVVIIVGSVVYFRKHPDKWDQVKKSAAVARYSTQNKV
ncbi:protein DD3-3-like [Branchiostoma floridae x Branchiostoma japonicum]